MAPIRRKKHKPIVLSPDVEAIYNDPVQFISRLVIRNKDSVEVDFALNNEQIRMVDTFETTKENIVILKGRQIGSSTLVSAYLFWKWYTSKTPIVVCVMSHGAESVARLQEMWKRFYAGLPDALKRPVTPLNDTVMRLPDTGAEALFYSSEKKGGLRGFSANYVHLSEYAFADDGKELKATALAAVNKGRLITESTANNFGDPHYDDVAMALRGEGNMRLLFFPWSEHVHYKEELPPNGLTLSAEEEHLKSKFNLSDEQLYWRRINVQAFGLFKFRREYPLTIDEAYGGKSDAYFTEEDLSLVTTYPRSPSTSIYYLRKPERGNVYAIGVDVGTGTGGDSTVVTVMDKRTYSPVAVWSSNTQGYPAVANIIEHLSKEYLQARVLIESNGIAAGLLNELRHRNFSCLWQHPETCKDWNTNSQTKWQLFEELKEAFRQGLIQTIDSLTMLELRAFFVNKSGNIDFPRNLKTHGDFVVSLALAFQCLKTAKLPTTEFLPEWARKKSIEKLTNDLTFQPLRKR
jgi:hypothetical protein